MKSTFIMFLTTGLVLSVLLVPSTAQAGGQLHLDFPNISIGYYDVHDKHYRKQHRKHHYKRYKNRWRDRHHYYDQRSYRHGSNDYRDYDRRYSNDRRYSDDRRYSHDYRSGGRYDGSRAGDYRGSYSVCPQPGYSRYDLNQSRCKRHKNHYHCN